MDFDGLAGDASVGDSSPDAAIDAAEPQFVGQGPHELMPTREVCLDFFNSAAGDQCTAGPIRRADTIFAAFEFELPVLERVDTHIENIELSFTVDASDDDNSDTDLGEVHLISNISEILSGSSTSEAVLGADINTVPPAALAGPGQAVATELLAGSYLLAEDSVWLAIRKRNSTELVIEPQSARLRFELVESAAPAAELVDDSQLDVANQRTVYASLSACRNLDTPDSVGLCRFGSLKLDVAGPETSVAYLHFEIPDAPAGKTLVGAQFIAHTTRAGGAQGDALSIRPCDAFDAASIATPGAASIPGEATPLGAMFAPIGAYAEGSIGFDPAAISVGDFYVSLRGGGDTVFVYSHAPPPSELAHRPKLILSYE